MVGEMALLAFKRNIENMVPCDGRELNVSDYPALFSLIGTTYGGNGQVTFRVPKAVEPPVTGTQWYIYTKDEYPELTD
jgi:microcystin-dependent protein